MGETPFYRRIPGLDDLSKGRYGLSFLWFFLLVLPLILIIMRFALFLNGLRSLGLSVFLVVTNSDQFFKIFNSEIVEYWVAPIFLISWVWIVWITHRNVQLNTREAGENNPHSEWKIAWLEIRKNRVVLFFIIILAVMYTVAFLCPWLAPRDPNAQQDIVVTRYVAPLQKILCLKLKSDKRLPLRDEDRLMTIGINPFIRIQYQLLNRDAAVIFVNSFQFEGEQIRYVQGNQTKTIPRSDLLGKNEEDFAERRTFWLGSDKYGRDILSRIIYGSRISLSIGFLAMAIAVTLGTVVGAVAGYFGKRTDAVLMRWVDLMLAFPNLFLILMIVALFGNSIFLMVLILGLTGWMGVSRIVRGQFLALREMEYIQAAQALGFGHVRIIFKHLIPNALAPVIVAATLRLGAIILVEAGLSFLGVGVQPPTASWGNMVAEGRDTLIHAWWISTFPGLAIVLTVICFNVIGDGLRDALDPRLRN